MKLSNKSALPLCLLSKCSFTHSKLRFWGLHRPKISSCYTASIQNECAHKLVGHTHILVRKHLASLFLLLLVLQARSGGIFELLELGHSILDVAKKHICHVA